MQTHTTRKHKLKRKEEKIAYAKSEIKSGHSRRAIEDERKVNWILPVSKFHFESTTENKFTLQVKLIDNLKCFICFE